MSALAQQLADGRQREATETKKKSGIKAYAVPTKPHRGISVDTLTKFSVGARDNREGEQSVVYQYIWNEKVYGQKTRFGEGKGKSMPMSFDPVLTENDNCNLPLFGAHLWSPNQLRITVTEGEDDAMAHYEMMGEYPVVSVSNGVDSVKRMSEEMFDYLSSFESIIIAFDKDEAGRKGAEEFALLFPTKARIMEMPSGDDKDALDFLNSGRAKEYQKAWWNAEKYSPSDVVLGSSLVDSVVDKPVNDYIPYPFPELNDILYGMHTPEVILVTAPTKSGKSMFTGILENYLTEAQDAPIADLSIEDTPERRAETLVSLRLRRPLHFPEVRDKMDKNVIREAAQDLLGDDQVLFYKNFGDNDVSGIVDRMRYFIEVQGCKFIIFDHISYMAAWHEGDERKTLDRLTNELAQLAVSTNTCLIMVSHVNDEGKTHGSRNATKTCYSHIHLERIKDDQGDDVDGLVRVSVKLNRLYGRSGHFYLRYGEDPFGFFPMDKREAEKILGLIKEEEED
jgi:twinkle protein